MKIAKLFAAALLSVSLCFSVAAAKEMNVGFIYVSPIGDAWLVICS